MKIGAYEVSTQEEDRVWSPCLQCGQPANPELKMCPACESEIQFNIGES